MIFLYRFVIVYRFVLDNLCYLLDTKGIEAVEVCGVCACPCFHCGSTYVCIICTIYTYGMWSTYVLCPFDNTKVLKFYYLLRLRTKMKVFQSTV